MKITYRKAVNRLEQIIKIPVIDVRDGKEERKEVNQMVKEHNGNTSKYVPAKYGYGTYGPKKY